jgi:integrase
VPDLSRKRDRDSLPARREPYWQRLGRGAFLGFRRGPDTWLVRLRGRDRKQQYVSLGDGLDFNDAKKAAEEWLAQCSTTPARAVRRASVAAALETYLNDLKRHDRADAAKTAEGRFRTAFGYDRSRKRYKDRLANQSLEEATQEDFLEWRDRLRPNRLPRTVNRLVRAVSAALNRAHRLGHVGSPAAWRLEHLPDDLESDTAVFLAPSQRSALIAAASPDAQAFLRGLGFSGARPKELAEATVRHFDGERLKLSHRKGRPPKLRSRYVVLDEDGIRFFVSQTKNKLPLAWIFSLGAKHWRRDLWAQEIRTAISAHNKSSPLDQRLPLEASAYSFRHARISELLQVYGIDPLTVAAQTGTSLRMIERTYFKFIRSAMLEKLARSRSAAHPLQGPRD